MRTYLTRAVFTVLGMMLAVAGALPALGTAEAEAATTINYDASRAAEYSNAVSEAVGIWNDALRNANFSRGGSDVTITTGTYRGGSFARVYGLGRGEVYLDRNQIESGFNPTRVAAHELGHILGLDDHYSGPCSELMSGGGPGRSCTNPYPNNSEVAEVERNFSRALTADAAQQVQPQVFSDCFPGKTAGV